MRLRVDEIRIGKRHRQEMGDLDGLAESIERIGLLHPIVVTPAYTLIAGDRRLRAIKRLGRKTIDATVVDIDKIAHGEYAENIDRKDFTWAEAVAILKEVRPLEGAAAKQRQRESPGRGKKGGQIAQPFKGRAADKAARATGRSSASRAPGSHSASGNATPRPCASGTGAMSRLCLASMATLVGWPVARPP